MPDTGAEHQPGLAIPAVTDDFPDRGLVDILPVDRVLQLAVDELSAARMYAGNIQRGVRRLGDQRCEKPLVDQPFHRRFVGDIGEDPLVTFRQQPAVQAVVGSRQADDFQFFIDLQHFIQETAVHGVRLAWNQMALIYQYQVEPTQFPGALVNALNPGEQHLRLRLTALQPGGIDTGRSQRPMVDQLIVILPDQLLDMGQDQDALIRPRFQDFLDEGGHNERFSASCWTHDQRIATVVFEVAVDGIDRFTLVST